VCPQAAKEKQRRGSVGSEEGEEKDGRTGSMKHEQRIDRDVSTGNNSQHFLLPEQGFRIRRLFIFVLSV
jgi:hypothetical protein